MACRRVESPGARLLRRRPGRRLTTTPCPDVDSRTRRRIELPGVDDRGLDGFGPWSAHRCLRRHLRAPAVARPVWMRCGRRGVAADDRAPTGTTKAATAKTATPDRIRRRRRMRPARFRTEASARSTVRASLGALSEGVAQVPVEVVVHCSPPSSRGSETTAARMDAIAREVWLLTLPTEQPSTSAASASLRSS